MFRIMEIYLIRHSKVVVDNGICYGQSDVELDGSYLETLRVYEQRLPDGFDQVYSSPLKRCKTLAKDLSNDVLFDDRLKEFNFGDWELCAWDDISSRDSKNWFDNYITQPTPNGESLIEFSHRVSSFIKELESENLDKVLIVCHAGVIRCFYHYFNSIALDHFFDTAVSYNDIHFKSSQTHLIELL